MAAVLENPALPASILDTDLYKVCPEHLLNMYISPALLVDNATSRTPTLSRRPRHLPFHEPQQKHLFFSSMRREIPRICIASACSCLHH